MARTRDTGYISAYPVIVGYANGYGTATGGTSSSITVGGVNYTLLTFTSDGTLTVTGAGLFDVYMVSGGGGVHCAVFVYACLRRVQTLLSVISGRSATRRWPEHWQEIQVGVT